MDVSDKAWRRILKADIDKAVKIYCEAAASEAASIIQGFAANAMQSYYDAYDPIEAYNLRILNDPSKEFDDHAGPYIRTGQFLNNSYQKFTDHQGKYYLGGVRIDPSFTNHVPKGVNEDTLYDYVWDKGIHGFTDGYNYYTDNRGTEHRVWSLVPIYGSDMRERDRFAEVQKRSYSAATKKTVMDKAMAAVMSANYGFIHF